MISGISSVPFPVSKPKSIAAAAHYRSYVDNKKIYFAIKRGVDVVISTLVIVGILSWLSIVIGLFILAGSRGPVFFVQRRVGKAGKSFWCYKFRTMVLNSDADIKRADSNDPRVTPFGRILRLYNIDELPQFFNVFLGQMSIVGPRPHMHADCNEFSKFIKDYKFRTFVKPGITGLAQAKGFHGPVTSDEQFQKRFQWDAFYVRNANLELDIRIINATVYRRIKLLFNRGHSSLTEPSCQNS